MMQPIKAAKATAAVGAKGKKKYLSDGVKRREELRSTGPIKIAKAKKAISRVTGKGKK